MTEQHNDPNFVLVTGVESYPKTLELIIEEQKAEIERLTARIEELESKNSKIPSLADFMAHAKTLKPYTPEYDFAIEAKYQQWIDAKWKDGYNKPIKNWKSKLMNVFPHLKKLPTSNDARNKFDQTRDVRNQVLDNLFGGTTK